MMPPAALKVVETTLAEYGALTVGALRAYLAEAGEPRRYLYDLVADYPLRAGKMMRPSLCIATARVFGAEPAMALPTALAIELLHNALLIHDDIEDGSERRRGRPALHVIHGIPLALNAGDRLLLMSMRPLMRNRQILGDELAARMMEESERMARESAEGQALELGWREESNGLLRAADYLEMVLKKTCWLATIFPMRAGALIGSRGTLDLEPFVRFGFFLGAAFQIRDDLLNLSPGRHYGKELNGDLLEGKRTLMLIRLLDQATADEQAEVTRILRGPRIARTSRQVSRMRTLIDKYCCIDYAQALAEELAGAALHEFSRIYRGIPDSRDKRFIEAMALWVIERS
ncbi:MAG TPA: polyprenyl synthetase family protein [Candidatus Binataceae bacterium]|nr:polyprenyl synthetase family protein [Candidatus Binataceae bacterium]